MKNLITKLFFISLFACCAFFSIDKVYAASTNYFGGGNYLNYADNGWHRLDTKNSLYFSGSHYLRLDLKGSALYNSTQIPNYVVAKFCSYGDISTFTYNTMYSSMSIEQTSSQCSYFGSSVKGKANYAILETNPNKIMQDRCNTSGSNCTLDYFDFSITFSSSTDFRLMSLSFYDSLPNIDNSTGTIIDQNNTIINKQNETNSKLSENNQKLQEVKDRLDHNNQLQKETNDTIKDPGVDGAQKKGEQFFSGFSTDTHGLTSIITAPLTLIGNITSSTCSPLALEVPFLDGQSLTLPCMSSIYKKHFGSFLNVYQIATFGLVAYWVCVRIFALVKDFKNPDHDEVEVMDL